MAQVIGRFHWGSASKSKTDTYSYPTPWVSFPNITAYLKWASEVRKYRPVGYDGKRTKCELVYVDSIHTAESLLYAIGKKK